MFDVNFMYTDQLFGTVSLNILETSHCPLTRLGAISKLHAIQALFSLSSLSYLHKILSILQEEIVLLVRRFLQRFLVVHQYSEYTMY